MNNTNETTTENNNTAILLDQKSIRAMINSLKERCNETGVSMSKLNRLHILASDSVKIDEEVFKDIIYITPDKINEAIDGKLCVFELDAIQCVIHFGSLCRSVLAFNPPAAGHDVVLLPEFADQESIMGFCNIRGSEEKEIREQDTRSIPRIIADTVFRIFRISASGFAIGWIAAKFITGTVTPLSIGIPIAILILAWLSYKFFE